MDDERFWFDHLPSPGLCRIDVRDHGRLYRLEVLGLGVIEVYCSYSLAEPKLRIAQVGQPERQRG